MADFFKNLPSEITPMIISRLPLRSLAISKCVCKPWLHLVDSLISKAKAKAIALIMPAWDTTRCKFFELQKEAESHGGHCNPLTTFHLPRRSSLLGVANGLLLLTSELSDSLSRSLHVCNPFTSEYVDLCPPAKFNMSFGIGVSKLTGQHKVVCIVAHSNSHHVYVYTLGTGSWRRLEDTTLDFKLFTSGALVNGNLHWSSLFGAKLICCFDLEAERFTTFAPPPIQGTTFVSDVFALRDCLCCCEKVSASEIAIWLVKDYEVDKSWTKEFVIPQCPDHSVEGFSNVWPINVFENGDILMRCDGKFFFYYSSKTKTTQEIALFGEAGGWFTMTSMVFNPSFRSLKSFGVENVVSLDELGLESKSAKAWDWERVCQYRDLEEEDEDDNLIMLSW